MDILDKSETLETLYNKYGRIVYGIILKLTPNVDDAERIFCEVYKGIDLNKINDQGNISVYNSLILKAIQIVRNENAEINLKPVSIEKIKYLSELFFQTKSLDDLCKENKESRAELFKKVRMELQTITRRT